MTGIPQLDRRFTRGPRIYAKVPRSSRVDFNAVHTPKRVRNDRHGQCRTVGCRNAQIVELLIAAAAPLLSPDHQGLPAVEKPAERRDTSSANEKAWPRFVGI